ncbi:hypothetical protein ES706_00015 [subsurface metagenome]|nr:hypothetical protein [Hadesarchaea archaeon]
MTPEDHLKNLFVRFKEILNSKKEPLNCFCKYGVQVEGWLKGELLCFLDNEKATGRLAEFDREVPLGMGRKKVDFRVKMSTSSGALEAWIELKHWLIGYQKGSRYNAQFYFGDSGIVGIMPDVEKLSEISSGSKFILILITANPGIDDWTTGVDKFNRKFSPLHIESLTNPAEFPSFYFLGPLKISKR